LLEVVPLVGLADEVIDELVEMIPEVRGIEDFNKASRFNAVPPSFINAGLNTI